MKKKTKKNLYNVKRVILFTIGFFAIWLDALDIKYKLLGLFLCLTVYFEDEIK